MNVDIILTAASSSVIPSSSSNNTNFSLCVVTIGINTFKNDSNAPASRDRFLVLCYISSNNFISHSSALTGSPICAIMDIWVRVSRRVVLPPLFAPVKSATFSFCVNS